MSTEQTGQGQSRRPGFLRRMFWHEDDRYFLVPKTYSQSPEPEGEGPFGRAPKTWATKWWAWTGGDHASVFFYVVVGVILSVITLAEYWVFTTDLEQKWINSALFAMSTAKFFMVVAFFMHLKFDNKWFTYLFASGFFLAMASFAAVLALTDKLNG